jgi:UDP-N-acetyl-D-glucosamine dehydrogenase
VLGVAYKAHTADYRESPALDVITLLRQGGAEVSYHDPYVPKVELGGETFKSIKLTDAAVKGADCVAIMTHHKDIDYARVIRVARRVFDARNATKGLARPNVTRL